ncbi:MAG TPA: hypothetical protein VHZ95_21445, partial [Polyangiales bacterium]|nr:hypothetical protein [Polyangiales bacterium]
MLERWLKNWAGHAYTIVPNITQRVLRKRAPAAQSWSTTLRDPQSGELTLRGELRREQSELGSKRCVVVVHGLGGSIDRHYAIAAARAAERVG